MRIALRGPEILDILVIREHIAIYFYPRGIRRGGFLVTTNKPLHIVRRYKAYFDYARIHRDKAYDDWGVVRFKVNFDNCPLSLSDISLQGRLFFVENGWPKMSAIVIHGQSRRYTIKERKHLLARAKELQCASPARFTSYSKEL